MAKETLTETDTKEVAPDGSVKYYRGEKPHRDDGPAIIYSDGIEEYYINGKWHNEAGPAYISVHGVIFYYKDGVQQQIIKNEVKEERQ